MKAQSKLRVLVGTVETAGVLYDLAEGMRASGCQVTSVVRERSNSYATHRYDMSIDACARGAVSWPEWVSESRFPLIRLPRGATNRVVQCGRIARLIAEHDLFVFPWAGTSLTASNREFRLLKRLGKKIVTICLGSDVRHYRPFIRQYRELEFNAEFVEAAKVKAARWPEPLYNMRMAERFSDVVLSQRNQGNLAIRPYMHLFVPVNRNDYAFHVPARMIPKVVHAPSSKDLKGTKRILGALEQLRNEGVQFELRLLHGVPHEVVRSALTDADVVIDELYLLNYGRLGVESMASGCAYATCNRIDYEPIPANRPVWHIETHNLYPQLKQLLTDLNLRNRLAQEGREFVEKYHDHVKVARRILELAGRDSIDKHDHFPTYFTQHFNLDKSEIVPRRLKNLTAEIVQRWGLPADVDPANLVKRGLMRPLSPKETEALPQWSGNDNDNHVYSGQSAALVQ